MKKIVLIEDEHNIRNNVKFILENAGFKVFPVENGEKGLSVIRYVSPDLILCDILLDGISGYDILEKVIADPETVKIPFVFLTAKSELADLRKGMELGADDYIVKPFKAADLINSIKMRIDKRSMIAESNLISKESSEKKPLLIADKKTVVEIDSIIMIKASREYSKLVLTGGEEIIICKVLKKLEKILPSENFIRIHRSAIINLKYVRGIEREYNRSYKVYFKNSNETAVISQRNVKKIKEIILH